MPRCCIGIRPYTGFVKPLSTELVNELGNGDGEADSFWKELTSSEVIWKHSTLIETFSSMEHSIVNSWFTVNNFWLFIVFIEKI